MINTFVDYTSALESTGKYYPGTVFSRTSCLFDNCCFRIGKTKGKVAYITTEKEYDSYLNVKPFIFSSVTSGDRLFISSKSNIPRALLRTSGYSITYNKDNADYIVIPELDNVYACGCNFAVLDSDNTLTLFNVYNRANKEFVESDIQYIESELRTKFGTDSVIYHNDGKSFKVFFLPKVEEYKDLFLRTTSKPFAVDSQIPITGTVGITPENLVMWSKCEDQNLIEKTILNSDWKDYPFTLCCWLSDEGSFMEDYRSAQWNWLISCINYADFAESYDNRMVTDKDWNMLQDYILYRLGLEGRGFTTHSRL